MIDHRDLLRLAIAHAARHVADESDERRDENADWFAEWFAQLAALHRSGLQVAEIAIYCPVRRCDFILRAPGGTSGDD